MADTRDEALYVLAVEVQTDPLGRGYNGPGSENPGPGPMPNSQVADSLNTRNIPTVGGPVPLGEMYGPAGNGSLIDGDDLTNLRTGTDSEVKKYEQVIALTNLWLEGPVEVTDERYIEVATIFPGGAQTRVNMNNRLQGLESRGEELDLRRPILEGWVEQARTFDLDVTQRAVAERIINALARSKRDRMIKMHYTQQRLEGAA